MRGGGGKTQSEWVKAIFFYQQLRQTFLASSNYFRKLQHLSGDDLISREVVKSLSCQTETSQTQFLLGAKAAQMIGEAKTVFNIILGCPTFHRKRVTASSLLLPCYVTKQSYF